ncbi:hypothetical protein [Nocardia brasiliensis]|uniref:Uncharacterized protein n=1 Tax=Nocardia brasiliensis (strain ATCC 700358 / HUJEG-1) TaxID=1133849 RepID=K0EXT4_NOCB7|nr:hypothetical protein [Nocardia brasiliensis]AFU01695.1 hypothetical protein O3I_018680 [Nocardia brasiliensis ATCC 700358]OCF89182.1 hypothetical protein AW168_16170 [Nocardia brasiliensis]
MDDSIDRNLDTIRRRLAELEEATEQALREDDSAPLPVAAVPAVASYAEMTDSNDRLRSARGWSEIDLDAALTAAQRAEFERWRTRQRIAWERDDLVAVGIAGLIGALGVWFDSTIDQGVANALGSVGRTQRMRRWERAAKRLPIDYTGPGFGGRAHRVRSAGHDLARPFEALRQIRTGEFRGVRWDHGEMESVSFAGRFRTVESGAEALVLWVKHLAADFVTPMSLPLPGSSLLYELDNRELRKFAHAVYLGPSAGNGLNLRSGLLTPSLSVLATEVVIRTHVHAKAYAVTGSADLDARRQSLRQELLLAAHALVGAASAGKTVARFVTLDDKRRWLAVRHVNIPVLLRIGCLAVENVHGMRGRWTAAASWDELGELLG